MKIKVVLNKCYGGFSISKEAAQFMADRGSVEAKKDLKVLPNERSYNGYGNGNWGGYRRDDPLLILAVETLKEKANGLCAKLKVEEIEWDIMDLIENHDGMEYLKTNRF